MTVHASGTPLRLSEIVAEFKQNNNISSKKGVTWYVDSSLDNGKFVSANLKFSDFYSKRATDPATPGSYDVPPGTDISWQVPLYRNTMTVQCWGGGGRGGAYGAESGSSHADGRRSPNGGDSIFDQMIAHGGQGGQNAGTSLGGGIVSAAGGAGGTAEGGDVNLTGGAGQDGPGEGGQASYGTTAVNTGNSYFGGGPQGNHRDGTSYYPGGGGNGYVGNSNGKFPGYPSGAGAGGYCSKTYPAKSYSPGATIRVACGLAGAPQANTNGTGYPGQDGRVLIQWT
jgi:hypothetical protein